jgi:hypothetical protein
MIRPGLMITKIFKYQSYLTLKCRSVVLSVNCSTCFGWILHPSSGAQITVSTASGTCQLLFLPVAVVEERQVETTVDQYQMAVDTLIVLIILEITI